MDNNYYRNEAESACDGQYGLLYFVVLLYKNDT